MDSSTEYVNPFVACCSSLLEKELWAKFHQISMMGPGMFGIAPAFPTPWAMCTEGSPLRACPWTHPENHHIVNFRGRLSFSLMLAMHYASSLALNTNKPYSQTSNSFLSSSWYQTSPHCLLDSDISSAGNFTPSSNLFPYCNFVRVFFLMWKQPSEFPASHHLSDKVGRGTWHMNSK